MHALEETFIFNRFPKNRGDYLKEDEQLSKAELKRQPGEKDEEYYTRLRKKLGGPLPNSLGITQERVEKVLERIDIVDRNTVSVVVALLDDRLPSAYSKAPKQATFKDGASTSHLFCHAGILQHEEKKIDREGRDYYIKPLLEIGSIEEAYLDPEKLQFMAGHPKPKSPNNCYRLAPSFIEVLRHACMHGPKFLQCEDE